MKTKIFTLNDNNKIEFTEDELKSLLDEIYNDGYNDGNRKYYYTTPYRYPYITTPYYTTWCSSSTAGSSGINITTSNSSDCKTVKFEYPSTESKTKRPLSIEAFLKALPKTLNQYL